MNRARLHLRCTLPALALGGALCLIGPISACGDPWLEISESGSSPPSDAGAEPPFLDASRAAHLPELTDPCDLDVPGTRLAVTTTDFVTGALTIVSTDVPPSDAAVAKDVALSTSDAVPFVRRGQLHLVHRHGFDFVERMVQRGSSWSSEGQHRIDRGGSRPPNPHSIAVTPDGLAYVPLFGTGTVRVFDLARPPGQSEQDDIDLSAFADDDGNPEPSLSVICGSTLFVSIQRLSPSFAILGPDALVPIDLTVHAPIDLEPETSAGQGIDLRGTWLRQLRLDPRDPTGHTLLALTNGVERIDLATGEVAWVVPPSSLANVGADHYLLPIAFAVHPDGDLLYLASYGSSAPGARCDLDPSRCFDAATVYVFDRDDPSLELQPFVADLQLVERSLEIAADRLFVGTRGHEAPGLLVFDISGAHAVAPDRLAGPLSTGLPPYGVTVLP